MVSYIIEVHDKEVRNDAADTENRIYITPKYCYWRGWNIAQARPIIEKFLTDLGWKAWDEKSQDIGFGNETVMVKKT